MACLRAARPESELESRDGPRDECGVFGLYAPGHEVSRLSYFALFALQHRGQESAGIAAADRGGHIVTRRELGLVSQVFSENDLSTLAGELAIGHVRYSTTGSNAWENSQPVQRSEGMGGSRREVALAHNGNLINALELHEELLARGVTFSSTSDSEIIAAMIATHPAELIEDAIADVLPRLRGAFSIVAMTRDRVVAFRDPHGLRPLALGALPAILERSAWTIRPGASLLRGQRVLRFRHHRRALPARREPGEIVTLGEDGLQSRVRRHRARRRAFCVFEYIYFARPDSRMNGQVLQVARGRMGEILWREAPVEADLVIAVPDSGNAAARGLARAGGPAPGRRLRQEPLRRAHLHPARPGAAQARPAPEVQPPARGHRRQAPGRRGRLDRARQHDPPDRADAARRRRRRGPHAHLRPADRAPLPLRHRHVHARGDDRPRAHHRGGRRRAGLRLAALPLAGRRLRGDQARSRAPTATPASAGATRSTGTGEANGKYALEEGQSEALPPFRSCGRSAYSNRP